jgi:hypothetical protein
MKLIFIVGIQIISIFAFGQTSSYVIRVCDSSTWSQSNLDSNYDFDILTGNIVHNIKRESIRDINEITTVEGDSLKFRISYACGCGTNEKELITTGILQHDNSNKDYYLIKLRFRNYNKGCEALCHDNLSFSLQPLKKLKTTIGQNSTYLKFEGFEQLIIYK